MSHTTIILTGVIVVILICDKSAADCCTITLYEFISPYYTNNKFIFSISKFSTVTKHYFHVSYMLRPRSVFGGAIWKILGMTDSPITFWRPVCIIQDNNTIRMGMSYLCVSEAYNMIILLLLILCVCDRHVGRNDRSLFQFCRRRRTGV